MTDVPESASVLLRWLDTLSPQERHGVLAFLLAGRLAPTAAAPRTSGLAPWLPLAPDARNRVATTLAGGEGSQLVTIRMPADLHASLRDWCGEHGFTMAAVMRGLVERFLKEQAGRPPSTDADPAHAG